MVMGFPEFQCGKVVPEGRVIGVRFSERVEDRPGFIQPFLPDIPAGPGPEGREGRLPRSWPRRKGQRGPGVQGEWWKGLGSLSFLVAFGVFLDHLISSSSARPFGRRWVRFFLDQDGLIPIRVSSTNCSVVSLRALPCLPWPS